MHTGSPSASPTNQNLNIHGDLMNEKIIYLDNAATTFPKPRPVLEAMLDCAENYCGNAGRGAHPLALASSEAIFAAREALASLFGAESERVVFTLNTTYALNMAIKGIASRPCHVLISDMEHNSTLRPVARLSRERRISYDIYPTHRDGLPLTAEEIISGIISRLRPETKLVCAIHTSNICSYSLPIREIGALCHRLGLLFCVDAAQAAGHCEIDIKRDNIDILCIPGHKGLYAPQGVGAMILGESVSLDTLIEGGNGVNSLELSMGSILPERLEGGTLPTPSVVGLTSGIEFVRGIGTATISAHERALWHKAYSAFTDMGGITVYAPESPGGVLLFNIDGTDPDEVGNLLSEKGICVRTGYHCAPLAHKAITTGGGAVRASFSVFNTEGDVDALVNAVKEIKDGK